MLFPACLEDLYGDIGEGILLLDADWRIVWINTLVASFLGSVAKELIGVDFRTLLQQTALGFEKPEELIRTLAHAARQSPSLPLPCRLRSQNSDLWFDLWVRRIESGALAGSLLLRFSDQTPLRRLEAALAESERKCLLLEQKFQTILDLVPAGILHLAPDYTILWANRAATERTHGGAACFGRPCFAACYGRNQPCENCPVEKCLRSGREEIGIVEDGDGPALEVRVYPLPPAAGGDGGSVLVHKVDMTEALRPQEKTVLAGHLAAMGELAAGVAHEINNPATGVINCAQLLHDVLENPEREIAQRILRDGERISAIVRSLLSLTRPEPEKIPGVKMEEELTDILSLSRVQMRREHIILRLRLAADLPENTVNRQQIRQVFLNVINNARYALNQKYPGFCEEKVLEIRGECLKGETVRFIFLDYGTGIPAGILNRVMHPFFTTKPVGKGTGLGLSISRSIIADHGGSLDITSIEGEFTQVVIELPVHGINE